jgi:hypothetical protein
MLEKWWKTLDEARVFKVKMTSDESFGMANA